MCSRSGPVTFTVVPAPPDRFMPVANYGAFLLEDFMDFETKQKLDRFFNALYGDLAETKRSRRVRAELEKWIAAALAPDSPKPRQA